MAVVAGGRAAIHGPSPRSPDSVGEGPTGTEHFGATMFLQQGYYDGYFYIHAVWGELEVEEG